MTRALSANMFENSDSSLEIVGVYGLSVPLRNFHEPFLCELGHSRHRVRVARDDTLATTQTPAGARELRGFPVESVDFLGARVAKQKR